MYQIKELVLLEASKVKKLSESGALAAAAGKEYELLFYKKFKEIFGDMVMPPAGSSHGADIEIRIKKGSTVTIELKNVKEDSGDTKGLDFGQFRLSYDYTKKNWDVVRKIKKQVGSTTKLASPEDRVETTVPTTEEVSLVEKLFKEKILSFLSENSEKMENIKKAFDSYKIANPTAFRSLDKKQKEKIKLSAIALQPQNEDNVPEEKPETFKPISSVSLTPEEKPIFDAFVSSIFGEENKEKTFDVDKAEVVSYYSKYDYIQIKNFGLYSTKGDSNLKEVPSLLEKIKDSKLRFRMKYHGTNKKTGKENYSFTVAIKFGFEKSSFSLDNEEDFKKFTQFITVDKESEQTQP